MYRKIEFLLFVISSFAAVSAVENTGNKTIVSIFYETYCPDSITFFTKKFYPAYTSELTSYILADLVPYGNAKTNVLPDGRFTFDCEHGQKECDGNKVHACVLNLPGVPLSDKLKFINCTLATVDRNSSTAVYPTSACANASNLNYASINSCIQNTTEANGYMKAYGDRTAKFEDHGSVPFVAINGEYSKDASAKLVNNFVDNYCTFVTFNDTKPDVCKSQNSAAISSLTVLPVVLLSIFVSKLY